MKTPKVGKRQALKVICSVMFLFFLSLGSISSVYGQDGVQTRLETNGPVIVSTDELTVRVNPGPVPHFWYWSTDGSQDEAYHVKFQHLIEYNDANGDEMFTSTETVQGGTSFSLSSGNWEFSGLTTEDGDSLESGDTADSVKFSFTLVGPIRGKQNGKNGQQGNLSTTKIASENLVVVLTCHISADEGNKMKIDVYIENWNFASEDNRLAVRTDFTTDNGSHTIEEGNDGYQIGDAFFAYEDSATADGESVTVTANAEETERTTGLKVWFNYPSFTDTLDHDPTIGIGDLSSETGGLGGFCLGTIAIIVIPIAVLFAVAVRRRH
jgi:hypothetical protein